MSPSLCKTIENKSQDEHFPILVAWHKKASKCLLKKRVVVLSSVSKKKTSLKHSTILLSSTSFSKLPTHRPFTKQMNSVSGGSFGNLCGRGKELSTDSEHQPISRSRVDKCSAYFKLRYPLKLYPLELLGLSEQDTKPAKLDSIFVLVHQRSWVLVARSCILDCVD